MHLRAGFFKWLKSNAATGWGSHAKAAVLFPGFIGLPRMAGPKFSFSPDRGTLAVGESHNIEVTFCSEILGEFSEHFNFKLHGSDEPLSVHFKGHVVGPTFHTDVQEVASAVPVIFHSTRHI